MNITAGDFGNDGLMINERHPESGDNPGEREGAKKQNPEKGGNKERHLESGDNPDKRGKNM